MEQTLVPGLERKLSDPLLSPPATPSASGRRGLLVLTGDGIPTTLGERALLSDAALSSSAEWSASDIDMRPVEPNDVFRVSKSDDESRSAAAAAAVGTERRGVEVRMGGGPGGISGGDGGGGGGGGVFVNRGGGVELCDRCSRRRDPLVA